MALTKRFKMPRMATIAFVAMCIFLAYFLIVQLGLPTVAPTFADFRGWLRSPLSEVKVWQLLLAMWFISAITNDRSR
jgi:hypothetical protein